MITSNAIKIWFFFALLIAGRSWADDLPRARPEDVGLSTNSLDNIDRFYAEKVNKGEMAGVVILIARHGRIAHFSAIGYANTATKQKMTTDTLFRFYSMTKPITATALMMLYEEGRFQMRDPISKYIPEFENLKVLRTPDAALDDTVSVDHPPTIQDLLRHTAGFGIGLGNDSVNRQLAALGIYDRNVSLADMMSRVGKVPLRYQPGSRWAYSLAPDVQARLVEVLSGMSFDEFLKQRLFKPLGMKDTSFWLTPEQNKRLSAVHWTKNGTIVPWDDVHGHPDEANHQGGAGETLQEPFASINKEVGDRKLKPGSFGLVGTAEDYWRFAQMILDQGKFGGTRLLSPQIVQYMERDHLGTIDSAALASVEKGTGFGLGFAVTKDPAAAGFMNSEGSVWWDGAATTLWWADPKEDLIVVAMTQYLDDGPNVRLLRPQMRALVYSALTE
jgi:CubicO group peptidase (beta-lactamase class C family)